MAAPSVDALFRELDDHFASSEHEEALATCSKILDLNKEDKEGNHCKLVCLLHLSRFEEAKKELETNSVLVGMKEDLALETAYCFYRLSLFDEATRVIESNLKKKESEGSSNSSSTLNLETKLRFLLAQVHYRAKDFSQAMSLYSEICEEHPSNIEAKCNLVAACAAPSLWDRSFSARCPWNIVSASDVLKGVLEKDSQVMKSSHDFAYNVATSHISAGRFDEASEALELAVSSCKETAKAEKWSESELNDEMNILNCQLAYLAQLQLSPEAENMYSSVLHNNPSDRVVASVANNNISTLHGNHNLFDSYHKLERNFSVLGGTKEEGQRDLTAKLTPYQRHSISYNHALVLLKMGTKEKIRQAEEHAKSMKESFPNSPFPTLLLSSICLRHGQVSESLDLLHGFLAANQKNNDNSTDFSSPLVRLAIAQVKFQQKNLKEAISVLTESGDAIHFPGVTRVVVMLYMKTGELESAFSILHEATASLRTRVDELGGFEANPRGEVLFSLKLYKSMLSSMAKFAMEHGRYGDALGCYDQLLEIDPASKQEHLLSKFVALAYVDPEQAADLEKSFGAQAEIDTSSVDVNALEALPAGYFSQADKGKKEKKEAASAEDSSAEVVEKKKRKRKKKKLVGKRKPKGYAEGYVHPDAERWKPLKERSYYKRRRGRGANKEKLRGGHQGAGALEHLAQSVGSGSGSGGSNRTPSSKPAPQAKGGRGKGRRR